MSNGGSCMRKKRVDPALVLWSAAIVLFAGAFFLGRATLRGPLSKRSAPRPAARRRMNGAAGSRKKAATAAEKAPASA